MLNRINQICAERNLSHYRIEKDCGLSTNSIMKWNKSSPKLNTLTKVAKYLNVSLDYLCERTNVRAVAVASEAQEMPLKSPVPREMEELWEMFMQLNDAGRARVKGYISGLFESANAPKYRQAGNPAINK